MLLVCKRTFSMALALGLLSSTTAMSSDDFALPEPSGSMMGRALNLWATWYYVPHFNHISSGIPLLDIDGKEMGPRLDKRNWCNAALEGSVQVTDASGQLVTYNYCTKATSLQVDCSEFFSLRVGTIRYRLAHGPFGDGVGDYILNPYRTIAVDNTVIPYGTVIYIPSARGQQVTLPNGSKVTHDGYFFAGDKGGAIKQNHIDVFIGTTNQNPFSWIGSSSSKTFRAYVINDQATTNMFTEMHVYNGEPTDNRCPRTDNFSVTVGN